MHGYHEIGTGTGPSNVGGVYRPNEAVDIERFPTEPGYNVGWIRDGEWLQYTRTIPVVVGNWTAQFRVACKGPNCWLKFYIDGTLKATVLVGHDYLTGAYDSFLWTAEFPLGVITAGDRLFKVEFGGNSGDNDWELHQNFAAFDLLPPPIAGTATEVRPALYFCDENRIDDDLDLPETAIIRYPDPTLSGKLRYVRNFAEQCSAVVVRYKNAGSDELKSVSAWVMPCPLEQYVDHVEKTDVPMSDVTAQALANDLRDIYSSEWGTVTATFVKRTDLEYLQTIQFVGFGGVPTDLFRITNIKYTKELANILVTITAMPSEKFSLMRRINRLLHPDTLSDVEKTVDAAIAMRPPPLTGTVYSTTNTPPTSILVINLDQGGQLTCRGGATVNDRVICTYVVGVGYVAILTEAG